MSESDQPTISAAAPPAVEQTAESPPSKRRPKHDHPEHIGPYRIIEVIGEGGMGVVYKAEQREPVRRLVALKVIKLGMDTREVVARFEAERQALALMSHPNVAKVFEAGVTEQGRPYFAMEFVAGIPITDYCDQNKLTTRERLELFIPVCHAIQHAHQKGIIHRDLKPGNVLVSLFDGKPVPKVIDFGIAKAANQALTQKTLYTQTGALIGTPEYMSPEQAQTSGLDVDTRTDIYSLGVMLYELLTGQLPFDPAALRKSGLEGMARMIRETEPPKPSTRISLLGHDPDASSNPSDQDVARRRRSDFRALSRELRGDLDWITLKAMEKDRTRRYETANGLAVDIRRYLENEPISAHPPSTLYRLSKTVRKHKVGVGAAAAILVALLLGIIGTSVEMVRAHNAAREAQADKLRAQQAERAAVEQSQVAEAQRVRAMENEACADASMAHLLKMKGDVAAAAQLTRRSLDVQRQLHPGDHVDVAAALGDLAWVLQGKENGREAEQAAREALAMCQRLRGDNDPLVGGAYDRLGTVLLASGKSNEAELPLREAVAIYHGLKTLDPGGLAAATGDLGLLLWNGGKAADAEPLLRESMDNWQRVPGYRRIMTHDPANVVQTLALIYNSRGDAASTQRCVREYLSIQLAHIEMGLEASPNDIGFLQAHAQLSFQIGQFSQAAADFERMTAMNSGDVLPYMQCACLRLYMNDQPGYVDLCRKMIQRFGSTTEAHTRDRVAKTVCLSSGVVSDLAPVLNLARANVAPGGPNDIPQLYLLCDGMAEYRAGNFQAAVSALQRALDLDIKSEPRATAFCYLAMAQYRLRNDEQARAELERAREMMEKTISRADAPIVHTDQTPQDWAICQIAWREANELILGRHIASPEASAANADHN